MRIWEIEGKVEGSKLKRRGEASMRSGATWDGLRPSYG